MLTLKREDQYTKSGTKRKATIYKIISSLGFGIENDLDYIYELLYDRGVISSITSQSIKFSYEFITKQRTILEEEFKTYCQNLIL